ncbi:MAG TPA: sugar phosphate nucleotidyltransferase [Thermoanaerobaculia bacterium]|nr:sugar phosphate nucleotidyltransferase [Thermoanaerobaculia bacterium]
MQALVLAGGSGTRFWPLSRQVRPKQLLPLEGEESLLARTVGRLAPLVPPERVWVCTTRALEAAVRQELPEVPAEQVLAEPEGRDTAAAIAWTVQSMPPAARRGPVLVLPADHRVGDPVALRRTLAEAAAVADRDDRVLALGVVPGRAETGYGYLELGEMLDPASGLRRVVRFVEKPDRPRAEAFLRSGRHLWNAGIFAFRGDTLLRRVERHLPELAAGLAALAAAPGRRAELYGRLPAISIDHGVMERLDDLATLPLDCGWSDLGSWQALAEVLPADTAGNALRGEVVAVDCADSLLVSEEGAIAALGVTGLVVVRTGDAVLVIPKERSQEVRSLIAALRRSGRGDLL